MPRLAVWYVRISFLHLILGVTYGALILTAKAMPELGWAWSLFPSHIEHIAFGWMLQFAMGIAFWALPRYRVEPKRGNERPVWVAWGLLNFGVLLLALSPWLGLNMATRLLSGLAELLAVGLFAIHAWPRIKPLGA